jgi:hypothetical protein
VLNIISLGAGVQSTTVALMAAHGELTPMPECAIFADTGWEPKAVYTHLDWLMSGVLPFPVQVVQHGNIRDDLLRRSSARSGERFVTIPAYSLSEYNEKGIGRRQCTAHYKIEPLHKEIRNRLGKGPRDWIAKGSVTKWLGISTDEIMRVTPSRVGYVINRFPLIEQKMSRGDCLMWLQRHGYAQPPKSACIGCPYHNNAQWKAIRDQQPEEWQQALEVDRAIRDPRHGINNKQFLHRSLVPLDQVDLSTAEDRGQLNLFNNECEGMCGV